MKRSIIFLAFATVALAAFAFAQTQALRIIDGPRVEGTGDTWAVVAWTTNAGGSSIVRYGTDQNNLSGSAESPYTGSGVHEGRVTHRVRINNLKPGTTYYFAVGSTQGAGTGTQSISSVNQFTTKGNAAGTAVYGANPAYRAGEAGENMNHAAVHITDGPRVEGVGSDWAVIAWTTNEASSSIIRFGANPNSLNQTAEAPYADVENASRQTHRVRINNLKPHTTYYFIVDSGQGEGTGTQAQSNIGRFTTK